MPDSIDLTTVANDCETFLTAFSWPRRPSRWKRFLQRFQRARAVVLPETTLPLPDKLSQIQAALSRHQQSSVFSRFWYQPTIRRLKRYVAIANLHGVVKHYQEFPNKTNLDTVQQSLYRILPLWNPFSSYRRKWQKVLSVLTPSRDNALMKPNNPLQAALTHWQRTLDAYGHHAPGYIFPSPIQACAPLGLDNEVICAEKRKISVEQAFYNHYHQHFWRYDAPYFDGQVYYRSLVLALAACQDSLAGKEEDRQKAFNHLVRLVHEGLLVLSPKQALRKIYSDMATALSMLKTTTPWLSPFTNAGEQEKERLCQQEKKLRQQQAAFPLELLERNSLLCYWEQLENSRYQAYRCLFAKDTTIVFDNEERHVEIVQRMLLLAEQQLTILQPVKDLQQQYVALEKQFRRFFAYPLTLDYFSPLYSNQLHVEQMEVRQLLQQVQSLFDESLTLNTVDNLKQLLQTLDKKKEAYLDDYHQQQEFILLDAAENKRHCAALGFYYHMPDFIKEMDDITIMHSMYFDQSFTEASLKVAYKKQCLTYHPDSLKKKLPLFARYTRPHSLLDTASLSFFQDIDSDADVIFLTHGHQHYYIVKSLQLIQPISSSDLPSFTQDACEYYHKTHYHALCFQWIQDSYVHLKANRKGQVLHIPVEEMSIPRVFPHSEVNKILRLHWQCLYKRQEIDIQVAQIEVLKQKWKAIEEQRAKEIAEAEAQLNAIEGRQQESEVRRAKEMALLRAQMEQLTQLILSGNHASSSTLSSMTFEDKNMENNRVVTTERLSSTDSDGEKRERTSSSSAFFSTTIERESPSNLAKKEDDLCQTASI